MGPRALIFKPLQGEEHMENGLGRKLLSSLSRKQGRKKTVTGGRCLSHKINGREGDQMKPLFSPPTSEHLSRASELNR